MWKYKWNWEDMLSMDGWVWRCQVWNCSNLGERPLNCPLCFLYCPWRIGQVTANLMIFLNSAKWGNKIIPNLEHLDLRSLRWSGFKDVLLWRRMASKGFGAMGVGLAGGWHKNMGWIRHCFTWRILCHVSHSFVLRRDKDQWTCFWQLVPGAVAGSAFIATPGLGDGRGWWSSPQKPRHWALHGGSQTKTGALRASRAAPQVWQRIRKI